MINNTSNNKAVLLSIQPEWCSLILNEIKTVEIRKTKPNLQTPFKCFIYCTKPNTQNPNEILELHINSKIHKLNGKVVAEFTCDRIDYLGNVATDPWRYLVGSHHDYLKDLVSNKACLTEEEMLKYRGEYALHISDLIIYDEPKKLSEFNTKDNESIKNCKNRTKTYNGLQLSSYFCKQKDNWCKEYRTKKLNKPPQSWCYVYTQEK